MQVMQATVSSTYITENMMSALWLLLALPCSVGAWSSASTFSQVYNNLSLRLKRPRPGWTGHPGHGQLSMTALPDDTPFLDANGKDWPDDGRDTLPFDVYDVVPPRRRKIGVAKLDPRTSSGDTLWHGAKHYKILRVKCHYKYEGGRFVMRKKSIDAKELKRVAKERVVARLVYGRGNEPPRDLP